MGFQDFCLFDWVFEFSQNTPWVSLKTQTLIRKQENCHEVLKRIKKGEVLCISTNFTIKKTKRMNEESNGPLSIESVERGIQYHVTNKSL